MKQEPLNYHAEVYAKNWARLFFDFHADSAALAQAHIEHLINTGDLLKTNDWIGGRPDFVKYIKFKHKANKSWIEVYYDKVNDVKCPACGSTDIDIFDTEALGHTGLDNEVYAMAKCKCTAKFQVIGEIVNWKASKTFEYYPPKKDLVV